MTKLTKGDLENFIQERIKAFEIESVVVPCYIDEINVIKEYEGRQILELFQNADDAEAKKVSIILDKNSKELFFYNDGVPFDLEGIQSIIVAHNSSKVTSSYIGNKGLGFRSILSWAKSITIYSAGLEIEFSIDVIKWYLDNKLQSLKEDLPAIRAKKNLSSTCIPIPILGLPRVSEKPHEGCTEDKGCALKIVYDESKQEDIIKQIEAIDEQTLLFLPHIKSVEIKIDTDEPTTISDNKDKWHIHTKDEKLPDQYQDKDKRENKKYSITIAIPKSGLMEEPKFLYNYLPTKERVNLPFLLHATVDLNSSRNYINDRSENKFILQKAAEFISEVALEKLKETQGRSDWTAFRMMTPTAQEKDYGSLKPLYAKLDELKETMAIYPTIDKQYTTADKYRYYNDDISKFWMDFGVFKETISKMLQPVEGQYKITPRSLENFAEAITAISQSIAGDIPKLVSLIRQLFDYKDLYNPQAFKPLPLLIDDKNDIINVDAYIQDNGDGALTNNLPNWVDFKVIHPELSKQLREKFKDKIDIEKQQKQEIQQSFSEVRCLVGMLDFVDISYFDKTGIAKHIISQANAKLDNDSTLPKDQLIGEMLDYLYNSKSEAEFDSVQLLNEDEDVRDADELLLPTDLNKNVFDGTDTQYALSLNAWQRKGYLKVLDNDDFERFMKRLRVNQILEKKKLGNVFWNGYSNYLKAHEVCSQNLGNRDRDLKSGSSDIEIIALRDIIMERFEKIDLKNLLLFIADNNDDFVHLNDYLKLLSFYSKNWKEITTPYNYIRYQLSTLPCVKWKVFGSDLILDNEVNINKLKQETPNVTNVVDLIRTDFHFENINEIRDFLSKSPEIFPDGKNIRKLYKLVVDGLAERKECLNDIRLFASDADGKKEYHPSTEVFYSDNTCLPKEVIKASNLFRLDYPSRQGVDKITRIFGLKSLDVLKFEIKTKQVSCFNNNFDDFFRKLKPYFLVYAIQNAETADAKKNIANHIKNCIIQLVSHCNYTIDGMPYDLEVGEFINDGCEYYLNVGDITNIEMMKSSTLYCNAITEILGMAFKLETKNEDFIHVFQNFDFMKKYIDETRKDEIEECYKLLGISTEEKRFWEKYGELKGLRLDAEITNYYSRNSSELAFCEEDVKNVNFSEWNNKESVDFLQKVLETLESDDQRMELLGIVDLSAWHNSRFEHIKVKYRTAFVHKLWTILNDKCQDKRNLLLKLQVEYGNISLEEYWRHEVKTDTDLLSYLNQRVHKMFEQYGIDSEDVHLENDENSEGHKNLYTQLVKNEQDEKDFEDKRWMLYFEGYDDEISKYLEQQRKDEQDDSDEETQDDTDVEGEIVMVRVVAPQNSNDLGTSKGRNGGVHTTKTERSKARLGAFAEKQVDKYLRKMAAQDKRYEYRDEDWVSKKDDTLGYDFTYIFNDETRYLEVKALADHTFILTANEYKVAMDNKEKYDIATVDKKGKVTIHQAFFEGSPKFDVKDYVVSFVVDNNE